MRDGECLDVLSRFHAVPAGVWPSDGRSGPIRAYEGLFSFFAPISIWQGGGPVHLAQALWMTLRGLVTGPMQTNHTVPRLGYEFHGK